jgi:hypothetical protein
MRSVFVQWPLLLREGQRLLEDLDSWTDLNTIELSNFFLDWGEAGSWETPTAAAPLALPATAAAGFADLPVPVVDDAVFESVLGVLDVIKANGFSVACNVTPLYLSETSLSALSCVDITGKPVRGLRSNLSVYGCPNNPAVISYGEAMMREFATAWRAADAISLNHVEYPFWPQTGLSELFTCFCDSCQAKAETAGLDFERVRHEAASLYELLTTRREESAKTLSAIDLLTLLIERPYLGLWLQFRVSSMSGFVLRVVEAGREAARLHNPELKIGLEFQAPALSLLVGTDFRALAPLFDWLTPKFPDYLAAAVIPIVADEIGASGSPAELRTALRELLLLGHGPEEYEPARDPSEGIRYGNAFDPAMIDLQLPSVADLRSTHAIYPYLWQYDRDVQSLGQKIQVVNRHGFDGYFTWVWDADLTTDVLKASAETRRAAAG